VTGVHLNFAGAVVEKSFDWLNLSKFTCVSHSSFVRRITALENVEVRFQYEFDDLRVSVNRCDVKSGFPMLGKIEQIGTILKKYLHGPWVRTSCCVVDRLVVLIVHYVDVVVLLDQTAKYILVWVYTGKMHRCYISS